MKSKFLSIEIVAKLGYTFLSIFLFFLMGAVRLDANFVYVNSDFSMENRVSVIDTNTNTVVTTIPHAQWAPNILAITPNGKFVYASWADSFTSDSFVSVIDTATNTIITEIPLVPSNPPTGLAITPDGTRVYVTLLDNTVRVIDTATNTVVATIPTPSGTGFGIAILPNGGFAYVALDSGNIGILDLSTNTFGTLIPVPGVLMFGVAITPDGRFAYVTDIGSNNVFVIDIASNTFFATVPVGNGPEGLAATNQFVYICNDLGSTISVIDVSTNTVVATVPTPPSNPTWIAITPDGSRGYVAINGTGIVAVLDTSTNTFIDSILIDPFATPFSIAITPTLLLPPPTPPLPPIPAAPTDPSGVQAIEQATELVYDTIQENFDSIAYTGLMDVVEGTYFDNSQVYIIDWETLYTNEIMLTPSWCE